jgi:non-specific serine/threonine protein kinase/serine/threonine-protein kinase
MTGAKHWEDAKRLFDAVVDLPPDARAAYLIDVCASTPELAGEVESLLAWADSGADFLETPIVRVTDLPAERSEVDLPIGTSLGVWRIVDVIGRGGMGVVYRAERADDAFKRVAAIKVVRGGSHAADIVERFRRERETLAALDHPNIARVVDGGTTLDGHPYFVMEYVDGMPIDRFCDDRRLSVDARLALFETVCRAVQYAHQMLVVHRDLKPDNILVTGDGVPKLLDFGIARLMTEEGATPADDALTSATWLMTPDYASPEQMQGRAVTTATDVYSLGVLMHVLLTGSRPYRLTATTQSELRAQLTSSTLSLPSHRVIGDEVTSAQIAMARSTAPSRLARRLDGDLDAIVLRALSRDVATRYATVEQLLEDLERHRTQFPVAARARDFSYVTNRFVRRHAIALVLGFAALVLAAAGVAAIAWQSARAADAQARAERRFDDVRRLAHVFMFDVHDEIVNVPGTTRARELMVRTASQYLSGLAPEAGSDLGLQRELAAAFVRVGDAQGHPTSANLGDTAGARASYARAIDIAAAVLIAQPNDIEAERTRAMAHRRLSDVLGWSGDLTSALSHCELSGRLFAAVAAHAAANAGDQLQVAIADIKLGDVLGNPNFPNLKRHAEAEASYSRALVALRNLAAADPADEQVRRYLGLILERIGTMHESAQRWTEATAAYQESFAIRQALASSSPSHVERQRDLAVAFEKLGNAQRFSGDLAASATSYRGALAQFVRLASADPSNAIAARSVAISKEKLAATLSDLGSRDESVALLKAAFGTHQLLASRDVANAQARCDAARLAESIGDETGLMVGVGALPDSGACTHWLDSLRLRQRLTNAGVACTTGEDVNRLTTKLASCY